MPLPAPPKPYPGSYCAGLGQWCLSLKDSDVDAYLRRHIKGEGMSLSEDVLRAYRKELAESVALDQFRRFVSGKDPVPPVPSYYTSDAHATALEWIPPGVHADLIPSLIALLASDKELVRRQAARHLTAYGDTALVAHLPAVAEINRHMAVGVIDGFKTARLAGRAGTLYRQALEPLVETFVNQDWQWMGWDEPLEPALLHLNPEKGRAILLPRFDDFEHRKVGVSITAFVEAPHLVDSATLLRLVEEDAREDLPVFERGLRFGCALEVLAAQRHPAVSQLISETLAGPFVVPEGAHDTVHSRVIMRQSGAARALGILHSFPLDDHWLFLRQKFIPRSHMSTVESDLDTSLDAGVNCDGINQYLCTDKGEAWPLDLAALDRMEATMHAAIFRRLCAMFGPDGPPVNTWDRNEQLVELGEKAEEEMKAFDDAWYHCPELLESKRKVYAINHREELAALPDPRSFSL